MANYPDDMIQWLIEAKGVNPQCGGVDLLDMLNEFYDEWKSHLFRTDFKENSCVCLDEEWEDDELFYADVETIADVIGEGVLEFVARYELSSKKLSREGMLCSHVSIYTNAVIVEYEDGFRTPDGELLMFTAYRTANVYEEQLIRRFGRMKGA